MSAINTIGIFVITYIIIKLVYGWIFKEDKLKGLPGPRRWFFVGNFFQMDPWNPHQTFSKWSREYGDMLRVRVFREDIVVLNDFDSIEEMLHSKACSYRNLPYRYTDILLKDWDDIAFMNPSAEWAERKKSLVRSLNAYGSGMSKIERISQSSVEGLLDKLAADTDGYRKAVDMKPYLYGCMVRIITTLMYGRALPESDIKELLEVENGVGKLMAPVGLISIIDAVPWMRHLPLEAIQMPIRGMERFSEWIRKMQREHQAQKQKETDCIIDQLSTYVNKVTKQVPTLADILGLTSNLLTGGFMTTTATLYSLIIVLINHESMQEKAFDEIQQVTTGEKPGLSHRSRMHYVRALIEELLRFSSVSALNLPHSTEKDTTIRGQFIPARTTVMSNLWNLHHDERYFEEPWKFKPERFLTAAGELVPRGDSIRKYTLPFSVGSRVCPGENLARTRLFLIITRLLQKYQFLPEDDQNIPSCDPREYESGILIMPKSYKVKIAERSI